MCKETPTPHKHVDLIKAWADGAIVQYLAAHDGKWYTTLYPQWESSGTFRIRPTPKSLGQVAYEAKYLDGTNWRVESQRAKEGWERAALAAIAAYKGQQ